MQANIQNPKNEQDVKSLVEIIDFYESLFHTLLTGELPCEITIEHLSMLARYNSYRIYRESRDGV